MRAAIGAVLLSVSLAGCGTYVPNIQEFPGNTGDGQLFVKQILHNINCEITEAVQYIIEQDKRLAPANGGRRQAAWFEGWGIQTTLSLTMDEKGSVNPVVNWFPPSPASSIFNLAGTGTASSQGTRIDKINSFNTVRQFLKNTCVNRPDGLWMLSSDLKLREWLAYAFSAANSDEVSFPADANGPWKSNVISHQVKFVVSTSGGITPGWKLQRVLVNQSGNFLGASRDRTHDLTITLGPADEIKTIVTLRNGTETTLTSRRPSTQAADAHLASQIGSAVASAIRGALAP